MMARGREAAEVDLLVGVTRQVPTGGGKGGLHEAGTIDTGLSAAAPYVLGAYQLFSVFDERLNFDAKSPCVILVGMV
jgi:hypothetical protein